MKLPKPQNTTVFLVILSLVTGATVYAGTGAIPSLRGRLSKTPSTTAPSRSPTPTSATKDPPTAINIPKIGKNLPIKRATVRGNDWDMFPDAVAWLATSAVPGQGNVILYAHNWKTLWRDLYLLMPGDVMEIQHDNTWKRYVVSGSRDVGEHDVQSILSDKNQLTLYTCEGNFDQKRRVVYADPVK